MKRLISFILAVLTVLGCLGGCARADTDVDVTQQTTQSPTSGVAEPEQLEQTAAGLTINEVMPDNRKLILGCELDWVELYNPEEMAVDLDGYYLTDDPNQPEMMSLSGLRVPEQGYLAVTLDDALQLSEIGETVYLTCGKKVISSMSFGAPEDGESFDASGVCQWPTPGFGNTQDGYEAYLEKQGLPELIINEVMVSNDSYYKVGNAFYDWVELFHNSDQPIQLQDYYLTDRFESDNRFFFPEVTLQPGEYYMVVCSGIVEKGKNHASFKLAAGDTVYLAKRGTFVDALSLPSDLKHNESFGRSGGLPVYLKKPTPKAENTEGYFTGVAIPQVSVEPGMYDEKISVELLGEGKIYYTLDGTRPSTSSRVYSGPITVSGVTTIRTFSVSNGRKSQLAAYTYVVGKEHDLPVVTISINRDSMYGETGVLNRDNIAYNYEKEAVLTLIEDGEVKFTVPFGFRLHGNDSRKGAKQNFQLRFRAEYGASKLEYKLFDNRDIDSFDSLLLKGGSEDWSKSNMRDELTAMVIEGATELYLQAVKPVVLYVGGEYWGVYFLRERFSDEYLASHMGVSPESVDILFSSGASVQVGSGRDFHKLKNYVLTHDMSKDENYAYLVQQINVVSLMDWYICRTYFSDADIANIRRCRSSEGDGKWHWMFFDLDWGFANRGIHPVSSITNLGGGDRTLIMAVLANKAGEDAFLKRYAHLMKTVLNEENIAQTIDYLVGMIESEMPRDRARWNVTMSGWKKAVEGLRNFAKDGKRARIVLTDIKETFSLSNAEMTAYFGEMWTNRK